MGHSINKLWQHIYKEMITWGSVTEVLSLVMLDASMVWTSVVGPQLGMRLGRREGGVAPRVSCSALAPSAMPVPCRGAMPALSGFGPVGSFGTGSFGAGSVSDLGSDFGCGFLSGLGLNVGCDSVGSEFCYGPRFRLYLRFRQF